MTRIVVASETMKQLLDDLLERSRIGRVVYPPVDVSLSELANEAVKRFTGEIETRGVEVSIDDEVETDLPPEISRIGDLPFESADVLDASGSHEYSNVLPSILANWAFAESWLLRGSIWTYVGRSDYPDTGPSSNTASARRPGSISADAT